MFCISDIWLPECDRDGELYPGMQVMENAGPGEVPLVSG